MKFDELVLLVEYDDNIEVKREYYDKLIQNYKECKALFESVEGEKFCLTSLEIANGLTLEQKKEAYCYLFHRIDKLYGTRY